MSVRPSVSISAKLLAATLGLCLLIAAPDADARRRSKRTKKRSKPPPGKVLVLGSSSVNGALGKHMETRLQGHGFVVHRKGKSSAGLARPDYFDWLRQVDQLPIDDNTRGAVIYLGTNDGQALHLRKDEARAIKHRGKWLRWGHKHWERIYQRRVRDFAHALCKRGVWRVAFMTPVDTTDPVLLKKLQQIRRLQYRGTRRSRCAWAWTGSGDVRTIRREKASLPSSKRLRYKDGFHMTQRGAEVAWARIEKRIVRYLNKRKPRRLRKRRKKRRHVAQRAAKKRRQG